MYSTSEVAKMLNVTRRDVSYHCKKLGMKKIGNVYMISPYNFRRIKLMANGKKRGGVK